MSFDVKLSSICSTDSWAESNANIRDLNTLTLTYATAVYVKEVMLVELIRGGTASKLEVDNNGTFVTVWSRDVNWFPSRYNRLRLRNQSVVASQNRLTELRQCVVVILLQL
jgi:hypothetical protein